MRGVDDCLGVQLMKKQAKEAIEEVQWTEFLKTLPAPKKSKKAAKLRKDTEYKCRDPAVKKQLEAGAGVIVKAISALRKTKAEGKDEEAALPPAAAPAPPPPAPPTGIHILLTYYYIFNICQLVALSHVYICYIIM